MSNSDDSDDCSEPQQASTSLMQQTPILQPDGNVPMCMYRL